MKKNKSKIAAAIIILAMGWIVLFVGSNKVNFNDPASIVVTVVLSMAMYTWVMTSDK